MKIAKGPVADSLTVARRLLPILFVATCWALPVLASGDAESEHGGGSSEMIWQAVNLLLLLAVATH